MSRTYTAIYTAESKPHMVNGYDYENQAWVLNGRYESCAHPVWMKCECFGRIHAGEIVPASAYSAIH